MAPNYPYIKSTAFVSNYRYGQRVQVLSWNERGSDDPTRDCRNKPLGLVGRVIRLGMGNYVWFQLEGEVWPERRIWVADATGGYVVASVCCANLYGLPAEHLRPVCFNIQWKGFPQSS